MSSKTTSTTSLGADGTAGAGDAGPLVERKRKMADSVELLIDGDVVHDVYSHDSEIEFEVEDLGGGETSYTIRFQGPDGQDWAVCFTRYVEPAQDAPEVVALMKALFPSQ